VDKKITRRVVLGTTIAGLVAGPFIIRALKKDKELPDSAFSKQWKKHQKIINFPRFVRDDSVITDSGLFLNFPAEQKKLNMVAVTAISNDGSFSDTQDASSLPDVFTYTVGEIQIDTMKDNGQYKGCPMIQGNLSDMTVFARAQENAVEKAPPHFSFLLDGLKRFSISNGEVEKNEMPYDLSGITCMSLPLEFPLKTELRKRTLWQGGAWTNNYNIPLQFNVVGAGRLGDKKVLLIEGKTVLDAFAFQKHLQEQLLKEKREDMKSFWESKLKLSKQDSRGISILSKQYISTETGVVMRSEIADVLSVPEKFGFGATIIATKFDWS
jgi:hypothetical protein